MSGERYVHMCSRKSKCKGPEVGAELSHDKEASVARAERLKEREGEKEGREVAGPGSGQASWAMIRMLGFIWKEVKIMLAIITVG